MVTDDSVLARPDVVRSSVAIARELGEEVCVHVRGPNTTGRRLYDVASAIHREVGGHALFVSDRIDIALALDGAGVQLPRRGLGVGVARTLLGEGRRVGLSVGATSGPEHPTDVLAQATFVIAGSAFPTETHPGVTPAGPPAYPDLVRLCPVPVVAIGGISAERVGVLVRAGVSGVAVIRAVWRAPNPTRAAAELLQAWWASAPEPGSRDVHQDQ